MIIGIVAVVLIVIVGAIAGMFLLGGACCLGSMILSSDNPTPVPAGPQVETTTLFDSNEEIMEGSHGFFDVPAEPGQLIEVSVTTDGSPVDVMIMDSEQYDDYQDAILGLNDGTWYTKETVTDVVSDTVSYTAEAYDTYYVVIDNTEDPANGAEAGKDVSINLVITLTAAV